MTNDADKSPTWAERVRGLVGHAFVDEQGGA
jgi:hypothetical protein